MNNESSNRTSRSRAGKNRWVFISDTHCRAHEFTPPEGDVLVHCGDFSIDPRNEAETIRFLKWFGAQAHSYKVLVRGNHDTRDRKLIAQARQYGVTLLDFEIVSILGLKVLGLMNTDTDLDVKESVDVLVSHFPPFGILDEVPVTTAFGEADLSTGSKGMYSLVKRLKPRVHAFGHIHECGQRSIFENGTQFINACVFEDKRRERPLPLRTWVDL